MMKKMARDKEQGLIVACFGTLLFLLAFGTIFFHTVENWSYVDAFYFTSVTMTTVGYGDLVPRTTEGRVGVSIFALFAVGLAFYSLNVLARYALKQRVEHGNWLKRRKND